MEDNNKMKRCTCLFCLLCFCVGILFPIITNYSSWELGFLAGLGISGFFEKLNKIYFLS